MVLQKFHQSWPNRGRKAKCDGRVGIKLIIAPSITRGQGVTSLT